MASLLQLASHPNLAALPGDQVLGYVQAEPKASAPGMAGIRDLVEVLKNPLSSLRADTTPTIGDFYLHHAPIFLVLAGFDLHRASGGRKLDRVIQQNGQPLPHPRRVGVDRRQTRR